MGSIHEEHMKWVQKLTDRGETVLQPEHGKPIGNIRGYIKTQTPLKDAGAIFQDKDGAFGLFIDTGALLITCINWDELGLCDAKCWYEWMDPETCKSKNEEIKQIEASAEHLTKQIQESSELTVEIGKQAKELEDILNKYLAKLRAKTVYLNDDVIASLHNAEIQPSNWELFANRVLEVALQDLADKQER